MHAHSEAAAVANRRRLRRADPGPRGDASVERACSVPEAPGVQRVCRLHGYSLAAPRRSRRPAATRDPDHRRGSRPAGRCSTLHQRVGPAAPACPGERETLADDRRTDRFGRPEARAPAPPSRRAACAAEAIDASAARRERQHRRREAQLLTERRPLRSVTVSTAAVGSSSRTARTPGATQRFQTTIWRVPDPLSPGWRLPRLPVPSFSTLPTTPTTQDQAARTGNRSDRAAGIASRTPR